ncbi:MAG: phage tail protein [Bacteroidetes bacterium]|nr:phage tail protein [Bacteroidota bacterium]
MQKSFGIIAEGPTDQVVIDHILSGYFNDPDFSLNELQPTRDESSGISDIGGWTKVFEFCRSNNFMESFNFNHFIIIQIDSDVSEEVGFGVPKKQSGKDLSVPDLIENVIKKLVEAIGPNIYNDFKHRIIFAIAVHELECWLLPLYYSNDKKSKKTGCLGALNIELQKKNKFTIDPKKKNQRFYQIISEPFLKRAAVLKYSKENPSFAYFISKLNEISF